MADKLTREQALEYYDYLQKEEGLSPQHASEFIGETVQVDGAGGAWGAAKQVGSVAVDGLGRALDMAGGLSRTIIAEGVDLARGTDTVNADDWGRVARGSAPDSAEYMDRMGAGEMGSVGIPFTDAKITGRDALGFGMDVAADPLTYLSLGATAAGKAGLKGTAKVLAKADNIANIPSNVIAGAGKGIYKSGLKGIDQVAEKFGKEPVSDLLMKHRVAGSAKTIQKKMDSLGDAYKNKADNLMQEATDAKELADMNAAMGPAENMIRAIREGRDPKLQGLADKLEVEVSKYKDLNFRAGVSPLKKEPWWPTLLKDGPSIPGSPGVTPKQAAGYKTTAGSAIPQNEFADYALNSATTKANKTLAGGLRDEVENSVGRALGAPAKAELHEANDALGRILTTREKALMEANKEANKNIISSVDGGIIGLAITNPKAALLLAGKKVADTAKLTSTRTYGGRALNDLGTNRFSRPITSGVARRGVVETQDDEINPYLLMNLMGEAPAK